MTGEPPLFRPVLSTIVRVIRLSSLEQRMNDQRFDVDHRRRTDIARALAAALASEPSIVFAYLFGSFIHAGPFHDIDVGVYLRNPPSGHTALAVKLADRLSRNVGYPVDVRELNNAPVPFVFHAVQGDLLVSVDDECLANVLERTGLRYLDIAPVLRQATRDAFAP